MANHKSASKAHQTSAKKAERNSQAKSRIKTFVKKLDTLLVQKDLEASQSFFREVESEIMRGVKKGVLKLNAGSRKVSQLSKKVKALEPAHP